jgi:hypothetical protein
MAKTEDNTHLFYCACFLLGIGLGGIGLLMYGFLGWLLGIITAMAFELFFGIIYFKDKGRRVK